MNLLLVKISCCVLVFTFVLSSMAQENAIKKIWKDGKSFVISKSDKMSEGQSYNIFDENNKKVAIAEVSKCKKKSCFLVITKKSKNFKLKESYSVSIRTESSLSGRNAYLGYGGPLGTGFRLGFSNRFFKKKWLMTAILGIQSSSTQNVDINANMLSIEGIYDFYRNGKFKVGPFGELGFTSLKIDFTKDSEGPSEKVTTYFVTAGGMASYSISKRFDIVVKLAVTKNGLKESYSNSQGDSYNNPYGKLLLISEFGLRYFF